MEAQMAKTSRKADPLVIDDWKSKDKPKEWKDLWQGIQPPNNWTEDDLVRQLVVWSAHMYNWALDVKANVDPVLKPSHRPEVDPPPPPPFGS
jgi:hypothetical protein